MYNIKISVLWSHIAFQKYKNMKELPSFRSILNRKCSTAWSALFFEPINSFFSSSGSILCFWSEILSFFLLFPCFLRELLAIGDLNFCPRSEKSKNPNLQSFRLYSRVFLLSDIKFGNILYCK